MKENLTQHTTVPTPSRKTQVVYRWDEVSALEEILTDYIGILQHSYKHGLAAVAAREYAVEHPEIIKNNSKEMADNPDKILEEIKWELEQMKKDLPHIDKAISRAIQLRSRVDEILHINREKENEDDTSTWAWELQDGDSTNE